MELRQGTVPGRDRAAPQQDKGEPEKIDMRTVGNNCVMSEERTTTITRDPDQPPPVKEDPRSREWRRG